MLEATVAEKYSKALLKTIDSSLGTYETFKVPFAFVEELFAFEESRSILLSPLMPLDLKKSLVFEALDQAKAPNLLRDFFEVVIDAHRTELIPEIVRCFRRECLTANHIWEATVSVAEELTEEEKDAFERMLAKSLQKKIETSFLLDPELLGGFVLNVNQKFVDMSLKSSLESLTLI